MDEKLYQTSIVNNIDIFAKCSVFHAKNFVFQEDLTPAHIALSTCNHSKSKNIQMLDWPGNFPGVNPINNIWAYLRRVMQQIRCNSKEQLWKAVQHHWYSLHRKLYQNLVESMPKRDKSVINMKGHPTKY